MKKHLLTALLWVFAFVGFASAESFTFIWDWWSNWEYTPSSFSTDWWELSYSNVVPNYDCWLSISNLCYYYFNEDWTIDSNSSTCLDYTLDSWTYTVDWWPWNSCNSITLNVWSSNGGVSGDSWWIISWWVSAFTPIISSVSNIISEFIPYVVYIGLGILGVIIWFVAIKRLINWIRAKIFSSFK